MMVPYRLVIADDHPHARQAIMAILEEERQFSVVAQARNGKEAIELCGEHLPDLLLIDIEMPVLDGEG